MLTAITLFTASLVATPTVALTSPTDYQVVQRDAAGHGRIMLTGSITGADAARYRWQGPGLDGQWHRQPLTFAAESKLPAGGWYALTVQALDGERVVAEANMARVGVGEVFIVAGQSNAGNYGSERLTPETGLVSAFDGARWRPAADPQPGSDGEGGSFLPAFGDVLARHYGVPVGLAACAAGGTSVRQWLPAGARVDRQPTVGGMRQVGPSLWESDGGLFDRLAQRLAAFGPGGVRAVLWHQGESDAGQARAGYPADRQISGEDYRRYLTQLIAASRERAGWPVPWFTAQTTYHPGDPADAEFRAAMAQIWADGVSLAGPDTDALGEPYRDGVHFNGRGQREHGRLWAACVTAWLDGLLDEQRNSSDRRLRYHTLH